MAPVKIVKKDKDLIVSLSNHYCHDCKKEIEIKDREIKNGLLLTYEDRGERLKVFKCKECFIRNPGLTNFRKCEVYSRIVGYLRPVQQWNFGKQREFRERKEYKLKKSVAHKDQKQKY